MADELPPELSAILIAPDAATRRRLADNLGESVDVTLLDDARHADPAHELESS